MERIRKKSSIIPGNTPAELYRFALRGRAHVYQYIGQYRESVDDLKSAIELISRQPGHDANECARMEIEIAGIYQNSMADFPNALLFLKRGLRRLKDRKPHDIYLNALSAKGYIFMYARELDKALKCFEEYRTLAIELKNRRFLANALGLLSQLYFERANYKAAICYAKRNIRMLETFKDKHGIACAVINFGHILYRLERFEEALANYQNGLKIFQQLGHTQGIAIGYGNLANTYKVMNRASEALKFFRLYHDISESTGDRRNAAIGYWGIGSVYIELKNFAKAEQYCKMFLEYSTKIGYAEGEIIALSDLAFFNVKKKDFRQAAGFSARFLEKVKRAGDKPHLLTAYGLHAECLFKSGKKRKSLDILDAGINDFLVSGFKEGEADLILKKAEYLGKGLLRKNVRFIKRGLALAEEVKAEGLIRKAKSLLEGITE